MKILIVSQHFWPESFRINEVAASLCAAGCEVTVLTGQPNYPGGTVFEGYRAGDSGVQWHEGIEIQRVPLIPRGHGSAFRLAMNYLSFIVSASVMGAWRLRGRKFTVVFVYGTSPILQAIAAISIARLKRSALVTWVQDLWPESLSATGYVRNPRALAAVARVVRWIYSHHDLLLLQSPAFEAPVRALAPNIPLRYHPNPGDSPPKQTAAVTNAQVLRPGFNVVFAGNLGTAQALETVIEAAAAVRDVPDLRLVLIGSGQRSAWLAEEIERRGLTNVDLPGRFPSESMPAIYEQAAALLVTLRSDPSMSLTVPSKVQSYLAAGRPIVAAMDGEGARVVREANAGLVCPAEDAAALALCLRRVHALSTEERARMGDSGRQYHAEHFSAERLTLALTEHLRWAVAMRSS